MFKKCLLFVCSVCTLSVFASNIIPPDFSWDPSKEALEGYLKHIESFKNDRDYVKWKTTFESLTALSDKSSDNISYDQFKQIVNNIRKANNCKELWVGPQIIYCSSKFSKFAIDCYKDPEYKNDNYVSTWIPLRICRNQQLPPLEMQQVVFTKLLELSKLDDVYPITVWLKFCKTNLVNFEPTAAKSNLKKLKVVLYPRISENEQFKKIVVDLELMLKALE